MDQIKKSFDNVKQDILFLKEELFNLRECFEILESQLIGINKLLMENIKNNKGGLYPTNSLINLTQPIVFSADNNTFEPLKGDNLGISIGNKGVSTDRQTDRQTDTIDKVANILDSLDNFKKEIRLKFKRLTDQEFLVFSTIYQLTEEQEYADYNLLSRRLNLTESSIRDYVGRIIKKEIPIEKIKVKNKFIRLNISKNLKKVVSLPTILQLRNL